MTPHRDAARLSRVALFAAVLMIAVLASVATANPFPCPELMYEEVEVLEANGYRIVKRGFEDYRIIIVQLTHPDGTSWCWDTPRGQTVVVGQRDLPAVTDVNGNGVPDILVTVYGLTNGCDESVYLIELAENGPTMLFQREDHEYKQRGNAYNACGHWLQDVNRDGTYELLTTEPRMGCSTATTARVPVIMRYDPVAGYVPADPYAQEPAFRPHEFAGVYSQLIGSAMVNVARVLHEESEAEKPFWLRCVLPSMLLSLIYQGEVELSRTALTALYPYPDAEEFWQDVLAAVATSEYVRFPAQE